MQLVDARTTALIGQELDRRQGVVSTKEFQRWAAAVGDHNPLYFDAEYARAHGYRDVLMPPLFIEQALSQVKRLDALRPDGSMGVAGVELPIPHHRRMAAGSSIESFRPVYGGDEIIGITRLAAVSEKVGRSGRFVLVDWATEYTDPGGAVLSRLTHGVILT